MRLGVVDIMDAGDDDPLIFNQVDSIVSRGARCLPRKRRYSAVARRRSVLQHIDDARLLVGFENIVKRLQLKGFHGMFFPCGDKDNKRLMSKLTDVLRQQDAVQRRNIDIEKIASTLLCWRNFSTSRPSSKLPTISIWLWVLISQESSCWARNSSSTMITFIFSPLMTTETPSAPAAFGDWGHKRQFLFPA